MADTTSLTERGPTAPSAPARGGRAKAVIVVVLIAAVAGGAFLWFRGKPELLQSGGQAAAPAAPPPAVTVVPVARREVRQVTTFTGRVQAVDKVELRARVPGYLEKRLFQEGAEVKEGQLMFVIEQAPYQTEIAKMKGTVEAAQADLRAARAEFARQEELFRRGVGTQARVDDTRAKAGEAQGTLDRQQAELEQARINLSYTEVKAPISGAVGQVTYSVGNYVQQASGTLATIVSRDPMYAMFPVTQRELLDLRRRSEAQGVSARAVTVRLRLADGSSYDDVGEVDFVDVQVNQATDSVNVRARFPNPKRLLIDGQLVTVLVESSTATSALLVPQQALQFDQSGYFVIIVDAENRAKVQPVGIGAGQGTDLEITSGLKEGDRVVVEGVQKVRPNQVVSASERASAPR